MGAWINISNATRSENVTASRRRLIPARRSFSISVGGSNRKANRTDAVRSTVKLYEDAILDHLRTQEVRPDVWLIVVRVIVHTYGRPQVGGPKETTPSEVMGERAAAAFLRDGALFEDLEAEAKLYLFAKNFHHQLKAQLLDKDVVMQIVRETTMDPTLELDRFGNPKRSVQEPAKIAWNFATTLYFKARGQPWQLANVRPGVCYVGLVFKLDPSPADRGEVCCAAQMFLNSGNGVVFRGALGPWLTKRDEFHWIGPPRPISSIRSGRLPEGSRGAARGALHTRPATLFG